MDIQTTNVNGIYIGQLRTIGPDQAPTGIYKAFSDQRHRIETEGLVDDLQADRRVHGGLEKAIYHYPAEHYALLQEALPHLAEQFVPGAVGENISTLGLTDETVHIGDIFKLGTAVVQVSQPRRPCWKINHKFGNSHMAALIMSQAISGWYYRVLECGEIQVGDQIEFVERLDNSVSVAEIWQIFLQRLERGENQTRLPPKIIGLSTEWTFS
ncbi:MOSC domain-containing protein [Amphritea balenae]|uniref:MOSC domain-containing protein n=1 Tax=Amphritea balenae TaxID=452629 RepID=A0A3P1SW78_9GAMM|nr:MOSC domain-containing protein [Amphritea balenae]RRD01462.1 MOSC domain-containing protein [Amphritea balenae]GGK56942.1 hypothetical protein GCM10007941_03820 [Amphritea balenae]